MQSINHLSFFYVNTNVNADFITTQGVYSQILSFGDLQFLRRLAL